jgi:hypothetical protein
MWNLIENGKKKMEEKSKMRKVGINEEITIRIIKLDKAKDRKVANANG